MLLRNPKHNNRDKVSQDWLLTYSDTVTLLLAFFVILLSMSTISQAKIEKVQAGLSKSLLKKKHDMPFSILKERVEATIEQKQLEDQVFINHDPLGIKIKFSSSLLFDSGTAKPKGALGPILKEISSAIKESSYKKYRITIEGHTDDVPISTREFPSNWELSAVRATNIVRYLIRFNIPKESVRAIGLADSHPIAPNRDKNGNPILQNRAENRRVVMYIRRFEGI